MDPDGKWSFDIDSEGNNVTLNAEEGDNYRSFKKQSGLSNSALKSMFGDDYKNVITVP